MVSKKLIILKLAVYCNSNKTLVSLCKYSFLSIKYFEYIVLAMDIKYVPTLWKCCWNRKIRRKGYQIKSLLRCRTKDDSQELQIGFIRGQQPISHEPDASQIHRAQCSLILSINLKRLSMLKNMKFHIYCCFYSFDINLLWRIIVITSL